MRMTAWTTVKNKPRSIPALSLISPTGDKSRHLIDKVTLLAQGLIIFSGGEKKNEIKSFYRCLGFQLVKLKR